MGKIIKDGVEHFFFGGGSGSGDNIEIMTRAEYDALVEAGTVDADVVYFITDAGEGSGGNNVDLSELTDRVENLEQSFQDGCSVIANAVTEMGVTTAIDASPSVMAENIRSISGVDLDNATIANGTEYTIPKSGKAVIFYTASFYNSSADDSTHNGNKGGYTFSIDGTTISTNSKASASLGNTAFGWNNIWTGDVTEGQVVSLTTSTGGWFAAINVNMHVVIL